jgi:hypothetical protein
VRESLAREGKSAVRVKKWNSQIKEGKSGLNVGRRLGARAESRSAVEEDAQVGRRRRRRIDPQPRLGRPERGSFAPGSLRGRERERGAGGREAREIDELTGLGVGS